MAEHRVYDHTDDDPRPSGRRRQVEDWGVGEELFDRMPGRRFARDHDIPRGGAADGRRTIVIGEEDALPPLEQAGDEADEFASRDEAIRARREHEALWGGDEPFTDGGGEDQRGGADGAGDRDEVVPAHEEVVAGREEFVAGRDEFVAGDDVVPARREGVAGGRRTVKINGRPGERAALRPARRRPPRTVSERVGARPDRVAAWAFALGLLLIAIAILTAQI